MRRKDKIKNKADVAKAADYVGLKIEEVRVTFGDNVRLVKDMVINGLFVSQIAVGLQRVKKVRQAIVRKVPDVGQRVSEDGNKDCFSNVDI